MLQDIRISQSPSDDDELLNRVSNSDWHRKAMLNDPRAFKSKERRVAAAMRPNPRRGKKQIPKVQLPLDAQNRVCLNYSLPFFYPKMLYTYFKFPIVFDTVDLNYNPVSSGDAATNVFVGIETENKQVRKNDLNTDERAIQVKGINKLKSKLYQPIDGMFSCLNSNVSEYSTHTHTHTKLSFN